MKPSELSAHKMHHTMVMAFGRVVTKTDQRKIGVLIPCSGRRVVYVFNKTAEEMRDRLDRLTLSKSMMVFDITDAQYGAVGQRRFTWMHCICDRRRKWEGDHFLMPRPTKKQWENAYIIGRINGKDNPR